MHRVFKDYGKEYTIPIAFNEDSETYLHKVADLLGPKVFSSGFDRYYEDCFDSDDFPKVIFSTDVEVPEYCCMCHKECFE
jgi:hypothetical protein